MGQPAPERIGDEWLWAEFWTRYFTDREPRRAWVVERNADGSVVGYLTGTMDAARVERYVPWLVPGIIWHVASRRLLRRPASRRALLAMARSMWRGELDAPAWARARFPATCHLNLLPEARGRRLGRRLMELFIDAVRRAGVAGIHVESLGANEAVARLNRSLGFRPLARRPLRVWEQLDSRPMEVWTWGMEVKKRECEKV